MSWTDLTVLVLLGSGLAFFAAGSLGLLRFPDTASRLHALTKADNLGLGLVALAAAIYGGSLELAVKIALVWLFAVIAAGTTSQLLARRARLDETRLDETRPDQPDLDPAESAPGGEAR